MTWKKSCAVLAASIVTFSLSIPALARHGTANPTPTPAPTGPAAPALVAPAAGASLAQPIALDWNAVSATGGPIGSYTWQVSATSAFTTIIAAGFTNMESDPSIPTRTEDKLSGLP